MAANQSELVVVVPGVAGYVWDGTALTQITDSEVTLREIVQDSAGDWSERISTLILQE
jgi:Tfp pilus assembly protein PilP